MSLRESTNNSKSYLAVTTASDWGSFRRNLHTLSMGEKGIAFELITKAYLTLNPIYASKLRHVWLLSELPSSIRDYLELPEKDMGIDLVAETYEGEFWSIQCKYREDEEARLGWGEVSTFLGLTLSRKFSFGLICHTGDKHTSLLDNQPKIGHCSNDVWQELDGGFFEQVVTLYSGTNPKIEPHQPRPHQRRAVQKAKEYFDFCTTRGKLVMPCGTGKSLTAFWIAQEIGAQKILIVVPSLALMKQTLEVWLREFQAQHKDRQLSWLCVCSDSTVGEISKDDLLESVSGLGIPCLTNVADISSWLSSNETEIQIVFSTYQSGKLIGKASMDTDYVFDLGIFDEAHKTVGDLSQLFAYLLSDQHVNIHRRLFMTATERLYSGKRDAIASMGDPRLYGETFEHLSYREAISFRPSIMTPYQIITLSVTKSEITEVILQNKFVRPEGDKWTEEVEAKMLASIIALHKAMKQYPIKHAITYHSSVDRAKAFSKCVSAYNALLTDKDLIDVYHVNGQMSAGKRINILQDFTRSHRSVVTNSRCLVEGVDLPGVDCVLFADPRKSKVDIVQALGRALRVHPGKHTGYLVIPIVVDEEKDIADFLESTEYADLLTTLRDLASSDERIVEYFQLKVSGATSPSFKAHISNDLLQMHFALSINVEEFSRAIEIKCWDQLSKLSYRPYISARKFARSLRLRNEQDWLYYSTGKLHGYNAKPHDIPLNPDIAYGDKWQGWKDWLGSEVAGRKAVTFEIAREHARRMELRSQTEWQEYIDGKYKDYLGPVWAYVPPNPDHIYFREWKGWTDWLTPRDYYAFEVARSIVRTWGAKNHKDWNKIINREWASSMAGKLPSEYFARIPWRPNFVYRDKWVDWGDWLGNPSTVARDKGEKTVSANSSATVERKENQYRDYRKARQFVHSLHLRNISEWRQYCLDQSKNYPPKPRDIPDEPNRIYKQYWRGWREWLGPYIGSALTFEEARSHARKLNLNNVKEWELYCRGELKGRPHKPSYIPDNPDEVYKTQWSGWIDWLVEPIETKKSKNSWV